MLGREKQIEVHHQPQDKQFTARAVNGRGGTLTFTAVLSFTVELDRLFAV